MIVQSPAPTCLGSSSPFLSHIRGVRSILTGRFHPSASSQDGGRWPIQVTGVGFFDFKHGQWGVAPNAMELHPILAVKIGRLRGPQPATKPTGKTISGAVCTASVRYSTRSSPSSFYGSAQTAGSDGTASWTWHMESKGSGGTGTMTCTYHGASKAATVRFSIS